MTAIAPYALKQAGDENSAASDAYQWIKFRAFDLTLQHLERQGLDGDTVPTAALQDQIAGVISAVALDSGTALNQRERGALIDDIVNEICGFGPLQPFLAGSLISTDIVVNGPHCVYIERFGNLEAVPVRFRDAAHLMNIIQRIVSPIGRRVDESMPYVDGRLPDGSRVNVIIPPVALEGPVLSIRKFKSIPLSGQDLMRNGSLTAEMLAYLSAAIAGKKNVLICGGTGTGKTTLLNVQSVSVISGRRSVSSSIEDAAELRLQSALHAGAAGNAAGHLPDRRQRSLGPRLDRRNALRMRPDRIILGEVRSSEAIEMLQAMGTGHDGSMATIHANAPRDALERLEMLVGLHGFSTDLNAKVRRVYRQRRGRGWSMSRAAGQCCKPCASG